MDTVIIVPGFAESRRHFRRLIVALEHTGWRVDVIQPWERERLEAWRGSAVFVGHSMGAYYTARLDLQPALLIGVVAPSKPGSHHLAAIHAITIHVHSQGDAGYHTVLRLYNALNILRYWPHYAYYGLHLLRERTFSIGRRDRDMVVIKNHADTIAVTDEVDYHEPGHHDDILYRPHVYIPYIRQLVESRSD